MAHALLGPDVVKQSEIFFTLIPSTISEFINNVIPFRTPHADAAGYTNASRKWATTQMGHYANGPLRKWVFTQPLQGKKKALTERCLYDLDNMT
jgi:hypothetical protein